MLKMVIRPAEHILKLKDKLNKIISKNTGKPLNEVEQDTERDNYMDSDEALKYGLIDKVLEKDR